MVSTISLCVGASPRYPITISKVYVKPNSKVSKGEAVFQYTSEYNYQTGDPLDATTMGTEKRKLIQDYESLNDATIKCLHLEEGMVLENDQFWATVEEECSHEVQFQGLCVECGKDMSEITYLSNIADSKRAQISMVHTNSGLKVSQTFASNVQVERQRKLLKDRKLSLVVDLDMTILHAVCDPTVGEWKNDPSNPNHAALQDVKQFTLADGPSMWYYVKFRNGLDVFLDRISKLYELHIYTMGTRAYADEIAKLIDPDHKLFGDRIISRDENGSVHKKSLERLFPVSQRMVAIIDDRMDVWEFNLPHLVKVVPYDFFVGIGDIHASFLPKLDPMVPPADDPPKQVDFKEAKNGIASKDKDKDKVAQGDEPVSSPPVRSPKSTEDLDDKATIEAQVAEEEKHLAIQLENRPLLQSQQKLDSEVDVSPETGEATPKGEKSNAHGPALLRDDDRELWYVADNLARVHQIFYDEYDEKLRSIEVGQAGRVQQMKPGQKKRKAPGSHSLEEEKNKDHAGDLQVVPDVGQIMPRLKSSTLAGCRIVLSGLIPLGVDIYNNMFSRELQTYGAELHMDVNKRTTHVVCSNIRARTIKVRKALKMPHIKVVDYGWLQRSYKEWKKADETDFLIEKHASVPPYPGYNADLDADSDVLPGAEQEGNTENGEEPSGSQASSRSESEYDYEEDVDGILPDEANSPVDGLKKFDWAKLDDELAEFMGSDADDDDSEVEASGDDGDESTDDSEELSSAKKRKSGDISGEADDKENHSDGDDMSAMSKVAKKQRRARTRTSGLKAVKTVGEDMESGLPTPEVTGGEEGDGEGHADADGDAADAAVLSEYEDDDDLTNMLENEMFAELNNANDIG